MSHYDSAAYAEIQPIAHDRSVMKDMMHCRNRAELQTLKAVNDLAKEPYINVLRQQKKWTRFKYLALYTSLVPLLITLLIYYLSPMLTQEALPIEHWQIWSMSALFASVALAVAVVVDLGRASLLDRTHNNAGTWILYILLTTASVIFSTTGMLAVANYYASSQQTETLQAIKAAKAFIMSHAALEHRTLADIEAERIRITKLRQKRGSGYGWAEWNKDTARLDQEAKDIAEYASAKALLEKKRALFAADDSSNWLITTYANNLNLTLFVAAIVIGLVINAITESVALAAHRRLIKLNARLTITNDQWMAATMAANEAAIVAGSTLAALNHNAHFCHNFKLPFSILNEYRNHKRRMGDFLSADIVEDTSKTNGNDLASPTSLNDEQKAAYDRYLRAKKASIGETIQCPTCKTEINKNTPRKTFCSSTGPHNCKDAYHNLMQPERIKYAK